MAMNANTANSSALYTAGLTGGIASGKTSVSNLFQSLGVPIVDADLIAREVVAPGAPALQELTLLFNVPILTNGGELDRQKLREIIFADSAARRKVEGVLHPAIRKLSNERVQQHAADNANYVICAVPLLVETGQADRYDRIAVVDVPVEVQIERLMARDNTTREDANRILQSQASREQRLAAADDIIDNTGSLEELEVQVRLLHERYLDFAKAKL